MFVVSNSAFRRNAMQKVLFAGFYTREITPTLCAYNDI